MSDRSIDALAPCPHKVGHPVIPPDDWEGDYMPRPDTAYFRLKEWIEGWGDGEVLEGLHTRDIAAVMRAYWDSRVMR